MRTIKFRGKVEYPQKYLGKKDIPNGEFIVGELHLNCRFPHIHTDKINKYPINSKTIGQFTGLHDKNGKEIYEGDIVKHTLFDCFDNDEQHKSVVEYCDGMAAFFVKLSEDSDCGNYLELGWVYQEDQEIEVIGNIHDNPELLKTTNY